MTTTPGPGATDPAPSDTTPAAAPPPAPAPTGGDGGSGGGLAVSPVPLILCVLGAILLVISIFLNWIDFSVAGRSFSANGREVPFDFLWDHTTTSEDPSLIVALIPAALLIGVGALSKLRWLAVVGGILAIIVAILFGIQADSLLNDAPAKVDLSYFEFVGIAPWFALVGGILGVIGGVLPRPSRA